MNPPLKINYERLDLGQVSDIEGALLIAKLEIVEQMKAIARELRVANELRVYELAHRLPSGGWMGDRQELRKILDEDLAETTRAGEQVRLNQIGIVCAVNRGDD